MSSEVLEVEIDGPANESLRFRPLAREVRGRHEWSRCPSPDAHRLGLRDYAGAAIPGQLLGIDLEAGKGYLKDPLHEPEHAALAERIVKKGMRLPPAREEFAAHGPTWIFWIAQAVRAGLARIVKGKLPEALDETDVRKDFLFAPPKPSERDRLADAINRMAESQAAQTEALTKLLSALASKK